MLNEQSEVPSPVLERTMATGKDPSVIGLTLDAIGSVQFHPFKPLLMVSSGSRATPSTLDDVESDSASESDSDDSDSDEQAGQVSERLQSFKPAPTTRLRPRPLDDSLRIWSFA
jgi:hypothetical protein